MVEKESVLLSEEQSGFQCACSEELRKSGFGSNIQKVVCSRGNMFSYVRDTFKVGWFRFLRIQ